MNKSSSVTSKIKHFNFNIEDINSVLKKSLDPKIWFTVYQLSIIFKFSRVYMQEKLLNLYNRKLINRKVLVENTQKYYYNINEIKKYLLDLNYEDKPPKDWYNVREISKKLNMSYDYIRKLVITLTQKKLVKRKKYRCKTDNNINTIVFFYDINEIKKEIKKGIKKCIE